MQENPGARRANGGGRLRFIFRVTPAAAASVVTVDGVRAIFHADGSAVSERSPARPGETLTALARNLGPTFPSIDPGETFQLLPVSAVVAPVEVRVNGTAGDAISAIGNPDRKTPIG